MDLNGAELEKLASNAVRVARRSYRTGGVTVLPALERRLKKKRWSFEKRRFNVFGREAERCHACGEEIERLTAGGRNLFICPACQPRRPDC